MNEQEKVQSAADQSVIDALTAMKNVYDNNWGKEGDIDTSNIIKILPAILELQAQKSSVYGRSYCRHGQISIFFNAERKWDRISHMIDEVIRGGKLSNMENLQGTPTETFFDTVVDLASYSLLWVGYIMENCPVVWENFLKTNKLSS